MAKKSAMPPITATQGTLDPGTMDMLQQVVEDAWLELVSRGSPVATRQGKNVVCEIMAHRVFSQASHGELDANRLKQHALSGLWGSFGD